MTIPVSGRPEPLGSFLERGILSRIAEGTYKQGARLSPRALATEFGISHIPLREALSSLAAKGHIEYRQAHGFFTKSLSSGELEDIYRWRELVETEAITLALPNLTDDDIAEMERLNSEMKKNTETSERLDYLQLNRRFHFVMFERARSPVLQQLLNLLWDISFPYFAMNLNASPTGTKDHAQQIELARTRDLKGLLKSLDAHRIGRMDRIKQWESSQA